MDEVLNKEPHSVQNSLSPISSNVKWFPMQYLIFGSYAKVVLADLAPKDLWGPQKTQPEQDLIEN